MPFIVAAFMVLGGFVVMELWNWLMPAIFDLGIIDFWQALGLLILSKIFFGGFGMNRGCGGCCGSGHRGGHYWKHKFKKKWANMSEEDKEKWRTKFGDKCYSEYQTKQTKTASVADGGESSEASAEDDDGGYSK